MIARYTRPEMGRIFSDENRFAQWLEVELAASEALAETGEVPADAAHALRAHAGFDVARILEIESNVKHDVIAFTTAVAETMAAAGQADASRWFHYGLTSNDVVDTAQALVLQQASVLVIKGSKTLAVSLDRRAHEFKHTVQIGRTHGIHAEPTTFGLKLALWYDEMTRNIARLSAAAEETGSARRQDFGSRRHVRTHHAGGGGKNLPAVVVETGRNRLAGDREGSSRGVGQRACGIVRDT